MQLQDFEWCYASHEDTGKNRRPIHCDCKCASLSPDRLIEEVHSGRKEGLLIFPCNFYLFSFSLTSLGSDWAVKIDIAWLFAVEQRSNVTSVFY